eukprot:COSAG04_NODE_2224_length_4498_cov_6.052285_3_plen_117_part_00
MPRFCRPPSCRSPRLMLHSEPDQTKPSPSSRRIAGSSRVTISAVRSSDRSTGSLHAGSAAWASATIARISPSEKARRFRNEKVSKWAVWASVSSVYLLPRNPNSRGGTGYDPLAVR